MPRYTVIVIDHQDDNRSEIVATDSHPFSINTTSLQEDVPEIVIQPKKKPRRVVPNYDVVSELLSDDEEQKPKKKAKSNLVKNIEKQTEQPKPKKAPTKRRGPQELFEIKMENKDFDNFNAQDLVCYYRQVAERKGIRTAIQWQRDSSQAKKLQEDFTNQEIMSMIDFLFNSDQDYLDKKRTTVGIMNTGWRNTIFQDMLDWKEGKYTTKTKAKNKKREWSDEKPTDTTKVQIGWE